MEATFLILIGAALFSHAWQLLGLYAEGRTVGVFVAGLGLASLVALTMAPQLLVAEGPGLDASELLASTTVMKTLILLWAVYAVGVGAHGLWDFDERAIGFYCAFLTAGSLSALLYFFGVLQPWYGDSAWLALSAASLLLAVLAGLLFFYLAVPFMVLRLVAGWFLLIGGGALALLGMLVATTVVRIAA